MTTLAVMKARIAVELRRSDLTDQIASAITDAISVYQQERFRFSESVPSSPITFPTVAGQANYGVAANANIGTLFNIDFVTLTVGNTIFALDRDTPENLTLYNQVNTMQGQPTWYAYEGGEIILAAVPSQVWTVTLDLFKNVAAPASDNEASNPWMNAAEMLIRSRAKFEIATHVTRNADMAQMMSPYPPGENGGMVGATYSAWKRMKGTTNRATGSGTIQSMRF